MKNKIVVILSLLLSMFVGTQAGDIGLLGGNENYSFSSATHATSSVGIYSWSTALAADSSRGYVSFCNESVSSNAAIFLALGATSTINTAYPPTGIRVPSGSCYEMTSENRFYGAIYAIASSATSSLLTTKARY